MFDQISRTLGKLSNVSTSACAGPFVKIIIISFPIHLATYLKIKVFLSDKLSVTNYLDTTLWKPGIPGKDDTYHVNPINKIKVFFFNRIQYMSNLIPIKSSVNEFKMNMS
ncbi:hypothetical protein llap_2067 [Limosa lapponica baueri]|uniref:Uncharacterized protein n=1 Tax=Limosa lapponica baueri TaxID=1758121 RepID=A0A2I0UNL2_LIMLA|nr:hypothetical protein llap_2067 [Limosa lapponica baueri]